MLQRGVLTAEEAAFHPRRNEILRSVGVLRKSRSKVRPSRSPETTGSCSAPTASAASSPTPRSKESSSAPRPPDAAVDALVDLANDCGGPDNVTVQLLVIPNGWTSGAHRIGASGAGDSAGSGAATRADAAGIFPAPSAAGSDARTVAAPFASRDTAIMLAKLALIAVAAYWLWRSL